MLWLFLRRHWVGASILAILPATNAFVNASFGNATRHITDSVLAAQDKGGDLWQAAMPPFKYFAVLVICTLLVRLVQWTVGYHTRMPLAADMRRMLFSHVQRLDATYFENNLSGKLAHQVALLPEQMLTMIERSWYEFIPAITFFLTTAYFFFTASPVFAALALGWLTIYFTTIGMLGRSTANAASKHNEAKTKLTGLIVDVIGNIKNVIFYAAHDHEDRLAYRAIEATRKRHGSLYLATVRMRFAQNALNIVMWLTLYSLAIYAWTTHRITAGDFVMITTLGSQLITRAFEIGELLPDFVDNIGSARENIAALIVPRSLTDKEGAKPLAIKRGEIRFEKVGFAYNADAPVFRDLSFTIEPGQRVGLIGSSGAGKTTLSALLLRLQDVQKGRILIDGQNIADITQESLRRQIGLIPQDTVLFHRSLMDNIRYGCPEASDAEVVRAAHRAHAEEFIDRMPEGYQTLVGERGVKLSGGQRQRIAIARAFLKNAPILILDEATSALDSESESVIQIAMAEAMRDRTVIAIAHRLSTIAHLDRLIVLKDGVIVEDGSHHALLAQKGVYAQLWRKQSGGFLMTGSATTINESTAGTNALPPSSKRPRLEEQATPHDD